MLRHYFIAYFIFCRIPKQLSEKVFAKSMQKSEEPKEIEDRGKISLIRLIDVLNLHLEIP